MGLSSTRISVQCVAIAKLVQPFKGGVEERRHKGAISDFTITSYQLCLVPKDHLETQGLKAEELQTKASSHGVLTPFKISVPITFKS